jgi:hypothetical protein
VVEKEGKNAFSSVPWSSRPKMIRGVEGGRGRELTQWVEDL